MTESSSRWAVLITFPAATVMIAFASPMLSIFYGNNYAAGAMVMAIMVGTFLLRSFSFMLTLLLAAIRQVRVELKLAAITGIINTVLSIFLITQIGMEGAAIASFISIAVFSVLLYHYTKKLTGFTFSRQFYKMVAAGILTLVIFLLASPILISVQLPSIGPEEYQFITSKVLFLIYLGITGMLVIPLFVALSILLKCINKDDLSMLKNGLSKYGVPLQIREILEKILILGVK